MLNLLYLLGWSTACLLFVVLLVPYGYVGNIKSPFWRFVAIATATPAALIWLNILYALCVLFSVNKGYDAMRTEWNNWMTDLKEFPSALLRAAQGM